MFCKNCGNKIDDHANVCDKCGNSVGQPKKDKSSIFDNMIVRICIIVAVVLVARFVIAPIITRSYTGGEDVSDTGTVTDNIVRDNDGQIKTKIFELSIDGVSSSQLIFMYSDGDRTDHEDDSVISITGYFGIYDFSVEGADSFKQDLIQFHNAVEDSGYDDMSCKLEDSAGSFSINFSFTDLDGEGREDAAKLAASNIGISHNNGVIKMSTAENELIKQDYSLIKEF